MNGFESKEKARERVWNLLSEKKVARFPFPPWNRIPNFEGAQQAAEILITLPQFKDARRIKVNPDAPQRYVRQFALQQGMAVYMPTPRLRGGFKKFAPESIPQDKFAEAASLSKGDRWAENITLEEIPQMDLIVAGSVAVTRHGHRCGKGEGYSDLEYAILRELGHSPVEVVTTVHPLQIVESLPVDPHDLPLRWIATPKEVIRVEDPPPAPDRIQWHLLSEEDLAEMPILKELRSQS